MEKTYKGYKITENPNEWGYYEAINISDCDSPMIHNKSIEGLKTDIDEQVDMEKTMTADEWWNSLSNDDIEKYQIHWDGQIWMNEMLLCEDYAKYYARHLIESLSDEVMSYHYIHSNISEGHLIHGAKWARQELISRIK